jgi:hypothetical protein
VGINTLGGSSSGPFTLPNQSGNSGKVLTSDGASASWGSPAVTLIGNYSATTGTTFSISSIPQIYKHLRIVGKVCAPTGLVKIQLNDGAITMSGLYHQYASATTVTGGALTNYIPLANVNNSWGMSFDVNIPDYSTSTIKGFSAYSGGTSGNLGYGICGASTQIAAAVNKLTFQFDGGATSDFKCSLYGWN